MPVSRCNNMKKTWSIPILWILIWAAGIFGEIRCIYKAFKCNWEPVGKAEIVYTVCAFTPIGCIVGYFNIKDK